MTRIRITVLKTLVLPELQSYCGVELRPCPCFKEGQTFETTTDKPEGFCDWAWADIRPFVTALLTGGNFASGAFEGWMKDPDTMIACCTDGARPAIFELKRINKR